MSHVLLMLLHAVLVGVFFAFLARDDARGRRVIFAKVFVGMVVGAVALAWLLYAWPRQGVP